MSQAMGLVELNSIARGIEVADAMIKSARVELVYSRAICPGKYVTLVSGGVSAVENAVGQGVKKGGALVVDEFILPNIHPSVMRAVAVTSPVEELKALGIIEVFAIATAIVAADAAVKASDVDLIELRLGIGIGGKSFVTMTGDVGAVNAAVDAGVAVASEKGLLVDQAVIPSPSKELVQWIL